MPDPQAPDGQARRRAPGHRKKTKTQRTTVPAVAGVATLVVASAGAITLNNTVGGAQGNTANLNRAMPAAVPIGGGAVADDRDAASDRAARSGRGSDADSARQQRLREAREREQWERERAKELAAFEAESGGDSKTTAVLPRVIKWTMPLENYSLSASFGQSSTLWSTTHTGQDFAAPLGTDVYAIGAGTVEYVGWDGSYGKQIRVRHEDGTETWYCHLSDYAVSTGEVVEAGELLGYVGSTGNSTGSHLHLEVRPGGGDAIDPMPWMRELGLPV